MISTNCYMCEFYRGFCECEAFPDGIPENFLTGEEFHDKVVEGQEGEFVFEEKDF